jgi:hypothetical protein
MENLLSALNKSAFGGITSRNFFFSGGHTMTLKTVMMGLAARAHQKSNPAATADEAWAAAERTFHLYRERALNFLTMLALDRQTSAEARERRN